MAAVIVRDYGTGGPVLSKVNFLLCSVKRGGGSAVTGYLHAAANFHQKTAHLTELREALAAIVYYLLCYSLVMYLYYTVGARVRFRLAATKEASLCDDVKTPQLKHEQPGNYWNGIFDALDISKHLATFTHPNGQNSADEAPNRLELCSPGAAGTPPAASLGNVDLESGATGNVPSGSSEASDPNDNNNNNGGTGDGAGNRKADKDRHFQETTKAALLFGFGMVAEFVPSVMQVAGGTNNDSQKLLLWVINLAAAGCFFSSSFGLLVVVMRMLGCRHFSHSTLDKAQNISAISAITFMMAAIIMVFIFISVSLTR